jgi:hypothetical protein
VIRFVAVGLAVVLAGFAPTALAADLSTLQTSEFQANEDSPVTPEVAEVKTGASDIQLSMDISTLVANADGPKMEGSASLIGEMIVSQPGSVTLPEMHVTIAGHIVKTAPSVARIDLHIGAAKRSFVWETGEEKTGRFELTFSEPVADGIVPPVFPVSAIALVTREAKSSVVLVSVEKILVTIGSAQIASKP